MIVTFPLELEQEVKAKAAQKGLDVVSYLFSLVRKDTTPAIAFERTNGLALDDDEILDKEFHRYCESQADYSITLEQVRQESASIIGSLADDIVAEREERF